MHLKNIKKVTYLIICVKKVSTIEIFDPTKLVKVLSALYEQK